MRRTFKAVAALTVLACVVLKVTLFPGLISFQTRDVTGNPVYRAYGENNWYDTQTFKIWLTVDTDAQTVTVKWAGHALIALPLPGGFFMVNVVVWTDKGRSLTLFDQDDPNLLKSFYGTVMFERACSRLLYQDTWVHADATWSYAGAQWVITVSVSCSVYVETSSVEYAEA